MLKGIWVFGDSIVYGAFDTKGGWVQRLRTYLDEKGFDEKGKYYCEIYNLGIPKGETTVDLKKRILIDAEPRKWDAERLTLISVGINDSAVLNDEEGNWVNIEKYRENLKEIIEKAKTFSSQVVMIGVTLVDEEKTNPVPWDKKLGYRNSVIKEYNQAMMEVAEENNLLFIDLIPRLEKVNWKNMLRDGVHPNDEGHELIFQVIKDQLEEKKII